MQVEITLKFSDSNSWFEETGTDKATLYFMGHVAGSISNGRREGILADGNGNRVGAWSLEEREES